MSQLCLMNYELYLKS